MMMIITKEQIEILAQYGVKPKDDINEFLLDLDAKITEIGFNQDYSLNTVGLELQKLYDVIYNQN